MNAQNKDNYNTKIDKAYKVNVSNGITTISRADTVFVNIYQTYPTAKTVSALYLQNYSQQRDTSGIYITQFDLTNPELFEYYNVGLSLSFDAPIINVTFGNGGMAEMEQWGYSQDKTQYYYKAHKIVPQEASLTIIIRSQSKIKINIQGIAGMIK